MKNAMALGLDALMDDADWRDAAACRGVDDSLFFPSGGEDVATIAAAKQVCAECPVRSECLAFAVETNQTEGIWGGHTPAERRKFRRRWIEEQRKAS